MFKSGQGFFRFDRGAHKYGQSWDRRKMEERERARKRARAAKAARRAFEYLTPNPYP